MMDIHYMSSTLHARWGPRLRHLRRQRGLSVAKLARLADVDQGQLSKAERGLAGLGDDARIRLAHALGKRVEEIFEYPSDPTTAREVG
jgi:transcriptional regulator with XRE-family HTH domain